MKKLLLLLCIYTAIFACTTNADRAIALYNSAIVQDTMKDYTKAIAALDTSIMLNPRFAMAYIKRASAKTWMGDYDGATTDCSKAMELDPRVCAQAYAIMGRVKYARHDFNAAIAFFDKAISLGPKDDQVYEIYNNRALAKAILQNYPEAITDFNKAITLAPKNAALYFNRGNVEATIDDYKTAFIDYNMAIQLDTAYALAYNNRGIIRIHLNQADSACLDFYKARDLGDENANTGLKLYCNNARAQTSLDKANDYCYRAEEEEQQQDYRAAITDYTKAIEIAPTYAEAYRARGDVKNGLHDYKGAIDDYNKAITIDPKLDQAYTNRGGVKQEMANYYGAIADFTNAIAINPKSFIAYYDRGGVKCILKDYNAAIADYTNAIKIKPDLADPYRERGRTKIYMGEKESACADLHKAGDLGDEEAYGLAKKYCGN